MSKLMRRSYARRIILYRSGRRHHGHRPHRRRRHRRRRHHHRHHPCNLLLVTHRQLPRRHRRVYICIYMHGRRRRSQRAASTFMLTERPSLGNTRRTTSVLHQLNSSAASEVWPGR